MIIDLIKFSLESLTNMICVLAILAYIYILAISVAGVFKPVNYTYITNVKEDKRDEVSI